MNYVLGLRLEELFNTGCSSPPAVLGHMDQAPNVPRALKTSTARPLKSQFLGAKQRRRLESVG